MGLWKYSLRKRRESRDILTVFRLPIINGDCINGDCLKLYFLGYYACFYIHLYIGTVARLIIEFLSQCFACKCQMMSWIWLWACPQSTGFGGVFCLTNPTNVWALTCPSFPISWFSHHTLTENIPAGHTSNISFCHWPAGPNRVLRLRVTLNSRQ